MTQVDLVLALRKCEEERNQALKRTAELEALHRELHDCASHNVKRALAMEKERNEAMAKLDDVTKLGVWERCGHSSGCNCPTLPTAADHLVEVLWRLCDWFGRPHTIQGAEDVALSVHALRTTFPKVEQEREEALDCAERATTCAGEAAKAYMADVGELRNRIHEMERVHQAVRDSLRRQRNEAQDAVLRILRIKAHERSDSEGEWTDGWNAAIGAVRAVASLNSKTGGRRG